MKTKANIVSLPTSGSGYAVMYQRTASCAAIRRKVLVLDIDYTVVDSLPVSAAERNAHQKLAYTNGLPVDFFAGVRTDFKTRDFDLSNMAESIILMARRATSTSLPDDVRQDLLQHTPQQVLEQFTIPHHEAILEVEKRSEEMAYAGVAASLAEIRAQHPDALIVAHTDCPAWLGLLRLHNAGLLEHYDGIMGCATLEPEWLKESELSICFDDSHRWTEQVVQRMVEHYPNIQVVIGAGKDMCKPHHTGLQALLSKFNVGEDAALIHIDDKPMGATVVAGLKESGLIPNAKCFHAEYGYGRDGGWSGIDKSLFAFQDALPDILAAFAAVDIN